MKNSHADPSYPTLADALGEAMTVDELRKLATLTGTRIPARKSDLVDLIVSYLAGNGLRAVWESLDEVQQAAVAEVVHSPGSRFPADRFRARYDRSPDWGSVDRYHREESPTPLRFCFVGKYDHIMPDDLKQRFKEFVPPPVAAQVPTVAMLPARHERPYRRWHPVARRLEEGTEEVALTVRESERSAQRELIALLRLIDTGRLVVSEKTRRPSPSALEAITTVLDGGDFFVETPPRDKHSSENAGPIRAFAWALLVQAGGLAQLAGNRLQLTRSGRKAMFEPASKTLHHLWHKWLLTTLFDELSRIDCVKGQTGKGRYGLTAVASRRTAMAATLAACPVQQWIPVDGFFRFQCASGHDFTVTRDAWSLYISDPHYGSLGYESWLPLIDLRYGLCLLFEFAATLGLIDVAYIPPARARQDYYRMWGADTLPHLSRYDGLLFFRITPLGAYCLGQSVIHTPEPVDAGPILKILSNFQITTLQDALDPGDRLALDTFSVSVGAGTWRIESDKLLAAIEQGKTLAEVRQFLEARSGAALPEPVMRLLDDLTERCTRVQDRGLARLIECSEPALAARIASDARTRKHCLRAGERHLVVPGASEAAFLRALRALGYLVRAGESAPLLPPRARKAKTRPSGGGTA